MHTDLNHDTRAKTTLGGATLTGSPTAGYWRTGDPAPCEVGCATEEPALLRLFNELAYGLIVVDNGRQVTHINRAGRAVLAREQCLRVAGRALSAWFDRDALAFSNAVNKAFQGKRGILRIGASGGSILLVPLPGHASEKGISPSGIGHVALVFERSPCAESLSIAFFAQSHRLTGSEERVLHALSSNESITKVAKTLNSAASTVRTHLNHIREKTGAGSLRALVASVKSMPPLMPAFGE